MISLLAKEAFSYTPMEDFHLCPHLCEQYHSPPSTPSGIPPNEPGLKPYTSPTIRLPDGRYVMESKKIALALEPLYPNPSVHLDSPYQSRIESLLPQIITHVRPIFMPLVQKTFLNPPSHAYFTADREKTIGMSLEKYHEKNAEKGFEEAKPYLRQLGEMYKEVSDGPFLGGKEPIYADFLVVAWLRMMDRLGAGWLDRLFGVEGGAELKSLYEASRKWLERDNY